MNLTEFYDSRNIPNEDRISCNRNIIFVVPHKEYDISDFLTAVGLDKYEVTTTWSKNGMTVSEEVTAAAPGIAVQLEQRHTRKFPFASSPDNVDENLINRIHKAVSDDFVCLHHHDEYSLQDGLGTVDDLIGLLKKQKRNFCSITNHGSIGGWIKQYNSCRKAGIKPIFGCELYVSNYRGDDPEEKKKHRSANHLLLFAKNIEGFYNIIRIHNDAQLNGFYYSPRMNHKAAKKWGSGIIATSSCFLEGTKVFTGDGFTRIEDINDDVLTHTGNKLGAETTQRYYTGFLRTLSCRGMVPEITSTDDHKFLVVKKDVQNKSCSKVLGVEHKWQSLDKQIRMDRRREFYSEWTSDIEKGDWILFPAHTEPESCENTIDITKYRRINKSWYRTLVTNEGRSVLRKHRKSSNLSISELTKLGSWGKKSLYDVEKGRSNPYYKKLKRHLEILNINTDIFFSNYCSPYTSADTGLLKNVPESIAVDKNLMFLLGAYCAEGSSAGHNIVFSLNANEEEYAREIKDCLYNVFGLTAEWSTEGNSGKVVCCSIILKHFFDEMCGIGAEYKRVPSVVMRASFGTAKHFLRGYFIGDGHPKKKDARRNNSIKSVSVSDDLSYGIARIVLKGGYYPTLTIKEENVSDYGVKHKRSYWVSIAGKQQYPLSNFIWHNIGDGELSINDMVRKNVPIRTRGIDYYTSTVTKINYNHVNDTKVKCLNVERDHSFVTTFASVHNCMGGEIPQALINNDWDKAEEIYFTYAEAFDEFYIELQIIEHEDQKEVNRRLIQFAEKMGAPLVLACDSHYLDPSNMQTHELLMLIRQGKTKLDVKKGDEDVWDFHVDNLFYRNASDMRELWENGFTDKFGEVHSPYKDDVFTEEIFQRAMRNTLKIARSVDDIEIDGTVKLPKLYDNSEEMLKEKVNDGFKQLGLDNIPNADEYKERANYEYDVITKLGWADYFLVMERITSMAKEKFYDEVGDWAIAFGRGSGSGSLVSWCLGITDCDPVKHNLLFSRFLDESRSDPPDIDTDFHPAIRDRVKQMIVEEFGEKQTCNIGTYTTYKTRAAIIDATRALGFDVNEANKVTKGMDPLKSFETEEGEEEVVDEMDFDELCRHYPELNDFFEQHPEIREHAEVIRNQVRNMGKHAGGMIISDRDLSDSIPVQRDKSGQVISSWAESGNSSELSDVGYIKFDLLGLNNLPIISDCIDIIKENRGEVIRRWDIPIDDHKAIKMESKSKLVGIFQFENPATAQIVDDVKMESLSDVTAVTSLLRPGPKDMGMDQLYARRKNEGEEYEVTPCLEWIFKDTYGVLTFQEQIMQLAQELCEFDGANANKLRKAAGKKLPDLMAEMKGKFIKGAQPRVKSGEVTQEQVEEWWEHIASFARYAFCKAHATTYSMITTAEIWLKHNYFKEYMTSLCRNTQLNKKKHGSENILGDYINYARKKGVVFLPPCVNTGRPDFHINSNGEVRFGLDHVRNVASAAKNIASIAKEKPFESMSDFYNRCIYSTQVKSGKNKGQMRQTRPSKQVVESLIYAGAFDDLGTRNDLLWSYMLAANDVPQPTDGELSQLELDVNPEGASPDINGSAGELRLVKGVGNVADHIEAIASEQPFTGMRDFHERCVFETEVKSGKNKGEVRTAKPKKKEVENLIYAGAFDKFGDRREMLRAYYELYKNISRPDMDKDTLMENEVEMIGMCLSVPPLTEKYSELISRCQWQTIGTIGKRTKPKVFGRLTDVQYKMSRNGNPMYIAKLNDGMDEMKFFVFRQAMDYFRDHIEKNILVAVPLSCFEGSDMWFLDDKNNRELSVIKEDD